MPETVFNKEIFTDKKENTYEVINDTMEVHDKDNNLIRTIDNGLFKEYDDVNQLIFHSFAVSENGDIYIAASLNTPETIQIIKLNSSFEVEYITEKGAFSDCENNIDKIFIGKNGNPVLCTCCDTTYINEISAESGRTLLRYEIPITEEIEGEYGDYSIIYRSDNTIYGYNYKDDKTSELYSGNSSGFTIMHSYVKDNILITQQAKGVESQGVLNIYSKDGDLEKVINIFADDQISNMCVTADGTVFLLCDYYDSESAQLRILRLNEDGTTEIINSVDKVNDRIYHGFNTDSQGNICICNPYSPDNMVHATYVSSSGEQSDITYECTGSVDDILCIDDELYILCYLEEDFHTVMLHINKETHTIDNTKYLDIPAPFITSGSGENELYYLSGGVVFRYNIADDSSEKVFSWFDSDVETIPFDMKNFVIADPDNIFYIGISSYDEQCYPAGQVSATHLKKADEERLKDINTRNVITLGGMSINERYLAKIHQFNKNNDDYMIMATDYSQYIPFFSGDDSEGWNRLHTDIADGNAPDIILGDLSSDIDKFLAKDELADLNEFIRNDPDIDSSDLADNILDAFSYNGKLCSIPCMFSLSTFTAKEECTKNNDMLTFNEFCSLSDKFSDKTFVNASREEFSDLLISSYINENVDYNNLTCNFETDIFKKIIEKSKKCVPSEIYYSSEEYDQRNRDLTKDIVLRNSYIQQLSDLFFDMTEYNCEHISYSLKGIPSSSGNTSLAGFSSLICITNSSENKESAWEFIKFFTDIRDGYGIGMDNIKNPLSIYQSKNQKTINSAIADLANNHNWNYDASDIEKITVALNTLCTGKMISSCKYSEIYSLITEETDKFYNDTASLDETVSTIQSKVSLYLSEIS